MGFWAASSETPRTYIHALRCRVEGAALAIGRAGGDLGPLAVRPGPVALYSGR